MMTWITVIVTPLSMVFGLMGSDLQSTLLWLVWVNDISWCVWVGNRDRVIELISERRDAGSAIVGIFHDLGVRELLANRVHEVVPGVAA